MNLPFRILLLFAWLGPLTGLQAQVVDQLIDPVSLESDGTNLTIEFDDLRADASDTNFEAQHSDDLTRWTGIAGSTVLVPDPINAPNRHRLTADEPGGPRKFYRIIGYSTTAEDSDGDGLSDAFETGTFGSLANKVDSDYDGYSDGLEFANGTLPNDPEDAPDLTVYPQVQFVETLSTMTEGESKNIPIEFDRAYSGTVHYAIHPSGTGIEGTDFASIGSGTISVSGTTAMIPITSIENSTINPHRLIMIDVIEEPLVPQTYRTGGRSRHILCLADNDHYWSGTLTSGLLERNFRIKRVRNGGVVSTIHFVAGTQDGLPLSPEGGTSSQTTGIVPEGSHLATVINDSSTVFDISVMFPAIQQSKLFGDKLNAVRILTLQATYNLTGPDDQFPSIQPNRISGNYTETVGTDLVPLTDANDTGTFALVRNPSATPDVETPFTPIP